MITTAIILSIISIFLFLFHITGIFDVLYCFLNGHLWGESVYEQSEHTLTTHCERCDEIVYTNDREP